MVETKIIDCKAIAEKIKEEVKTKAEGKDYRLLIWTNPEDEASKVYVRNKKKVAEEVGIKAEEIVLDENTNPDVMYNKIHSLEPMIVQLPMNSKLNKEFIEAYLMSNKYRDPDGLCKNALVLPATARAVLRIIQEIGYDIGGKNVCLIGRSKLCNKALIEPLLDANATVTICHSHTKDLKEITKLADLIIVAVGQAKMITSDYIKDGASLIDVGINRDENGKLCGDVDLESCIGKANFITPVPGGCGVLTVACLMENVVELYNKLMNP